METEFKTDEHRLRTGRNETLLTESRFCDTDLEKKSFAASVWPQHLSRYIFFNTTVSQKHIMIQVEIPVSASKLENTDKLLLTEDSDSIEPQETSE